MATCYSTDESSYFFLNWTNIESCSEIGLSCKFIWDICTIEKLCLGCLCFPQVSLAQLFQRFSFSYTTRGCQGTFQKDYCSTIPTYHGNLKKRFCLKDSAKNPIKTMDISSLLKTDLGNLNDWSMILQDNLLTIYDTI